MAVTFPSEVQKIVTTTIPSTKYTVASRKAKDIRLIVLHLAITAETKTAAEAVARYFQSGVRASSHFTTDNDSIVGQVRLEDVAWAAPGANHDGVQIEQAGSIQSPAQWSDDYSLDMLNNTARLTAALCRVLGIPPVRLTDAEIRDGKRGIVDHWAVNRVYRRSDHTDCGEHFPWKTFMALVVRFYNAADKTTTTPAPKPTPTPTPTKGLNVKTIDLRNAHKIPVKGSNIKPLQRLLRVKDDGIAGSATRTALGAAQKRAGLRVDYIFGTKTAEAFLAGKG